MTAQHKATASAVTTQQEDERAIGILRGPTFVIARRALASHLRSGWLWGEVMLVLALFVALFNFPGQGDAHYLFSVGSLTLGGEAVLATAIIIQRAFRAGAYLSLARLTGRAAYIRGQILAAGVLRLPLYLLLLALYLYAHGLPHPGYTIPLHGEVAAPVSVRLLATLFGSVGLLANCLVFVALTAALSSPISTRIEVIAFLAWLVVALSSYASAGPFAPLLTIARLPLLPVVACSNLGIDGSLTWQDVAALLAQAGYITVLVLFAQWQLARRDLLLQ
ncbi:MAG TPA: hypothetical protein VF510_25790 [Ktedonobacterales bacterium]